MDKFTKILIAIAIIFITFVLVFLTNLFLTTNRIQNAKKDNINLDPINLALCEERGNQYSMDIGCIKESFGVSTYFMYLASSFIIFLILIFLSPKPKNFLFVPIVGILWVLFSNMIIRIFDIPLIHVVPMEGDIEILNGPFQFDVYSDTIFFILILIASFFGASLGYGFSYWIREIKFGTRNF